MQDKLIYPERIVVTFDLSKKQEFAGRAENEIIPQRCTTSNCAAADDLSLYGKDGRAAVYILVDESPCFPSKPQ